MKLRTIVLFLALCFPVYAQTYQQAVTVSGTSHTFTNPQSGRQYIFTSGSSVAVTLPQAGASSLFRSGWFVEVKVTGAGTVTITPTTSTIGGAATLVLTTGQSAKISSNGTNYLVTRLDISDAQRTKVDFLGTVTSNVQTQIDAKAPLATTLSRLFPFGSEAPATNFATIDTRNQHPVLDFDASTAESTVWTDVLHRHYAGGNISVVITWAATSATTGDVVWAASFERIDATGLDIDADSFATEQTTTTTTSGTSGVTVITTITFTSSQIDGLLAGEPFRIKVRRDAAAGGDTMAGDAEVISVEIRQ